MTKLKIVKIGGNIIDHIQGQLYNDKGAIATDKSGNTFTVSVSIHEDLINGTVGIGQYTLIYTATNSSGTVSTATRTVNVIAQS